MPTKIDMPLPSTHLEQSRNAGDVEPFPSGRITYLAPLPLPTPLPPHGPHIGELNEVYMDFGLGSPQVFMWQITLGGPFSGAFMIAFLFPIIGGFLGLVLGYGWEDISDSIQGIFHASYPLAMQTGFFGPCSSASASGTTTTKKRLQIIPTRFNRQRREVCFMPEDATEPVFVPWESLSAWVIEAQGATQYGIHRQYGMGIGFQHGETLTSVEFPCFGLSPGHQPLGSHPRLHGIRNPRPQSHPGPARPARPRRPAPRRPAHFPQRPCAHASANPRRPTGSSVRLLLVPVPRHDAVDDSQPPDRMGSPPPPEKWPRTPCPK